MKVFRAIHIRKKQIVMGLAGIALLCGAVAVLPPAVTKASAVVSASVVLIPKNLKLPSVLTRLGELMIPMSFCAFSGKMTSRRRFFSAVIGSKNIPRRSKKLPPMGMTSGTIPRPILI